jgi:hypothetical protein
MLSLRIERPHLNCADNCSDMISNLPHMISMQILSFLDPVSLARACQVNKQWNELGSEGILWKKWCFMPKWRFSQATEEKQLQKFRDPEDNSIIVSFKFLISFATHQSQKPFFFSVKSCLVETSF